MRPRPVTIASIFVFVASAIGACATQQETGAGAGGASAVAAGGGSRPVNTATGTTTGAGGGASTTSSSSTGEAGGSAGGGSSSSSGGSGCAHDPCTQGAALDAGCDACVATVCASDGFCCTDTWDEVCVSEVGSYCGNDCGGGGGGGALGPGDLVITEIMNNPKAVADSAGEWFELRNTTGGAVDLAGLVIRHDAADPAAVHTIGASVVVPGGGYVVLGVNGDAGTNGGVDVAYVYPAAVSLGNGADYLAIETADAQPVVLDETSWDEASGFDPDGASRSLDPGFTSAAANDDDAHFCAATTLVGAAGSDHGTPGAANDPCN